MKQTILKIVMGVLLVFLTDRGLGLYFDRLYEQNYYHYAHGHLNFYIKKVKCDTLLLGSSRVLDGLVPTVFGPSTFSIAEASKHLGWCTAVVELLNQYNRLPSKTMIINIEPEDFLEESSDKLLNDIHFLKYYYHQNSFIRNEINKAAPFEKFKYLSSLYRHNGNDLILITNPWQNIGHLPIKNGYFPIVPTPQDSIRTLQDIDTLHHPKPNFNNPRAKYYLSRIQRICLKNKIQLIVITAPVYKVNSRSLLCSAYLKNILTLKGIPYINYLGKDIGELNRLDFWFDNYHFVDAGAQKFSRLVKRDILKIR